MQLLIFDWILRSDNQQAEWSKNIIWTTKALNNIGLKPSILCINEKVWWKKMYSIAKKLFILQDAFQEKKCVRFRKKHVFLSQFYFGRCQLAAAWHAILQLFLVPLLCECTFLCSIRSVSNWMKYLLDYFCRISPAAN